MSGGVWGAVIRSGWNAVLAQLLDAQNERVAELGRQIASTLPQRTGTAIAITSVALFDSETGARSERNGALPRRAVAAVARPS